MITEWQAHGGAVNTSTSPKVQYAYSEMASSANHSRLTSMTYPSGYVLTFSYSSGLNSNVSRLSSISDSSGSLESYDYLGYGTVVIRGHSQPGVDLTYVGTPADGGDQYAGLDRFGRVVDQKWVKSGTPLDRFQYGYDRDSNRTYRDNLVNTAFGEVYGYDNLGQLTAFDRGTLNGGKTGISGVVARSQDWDYDALGNWDSLTTNGGSPQTRTHNAQNEITSVSGAATPTFDANGNMTTDETGRQSVYDAWNRLVTVKSSGGTTLKSYTYDGINRRVTETASGTTTDLFYSSQWQVLEERVGSNTTKRYVWSPVYVDALVLRDRDTNADGTLDERLWVMQDANFNVVGLVNGSGAVVERYVYDPFGVATVLDGSYGSRGTSSYGWQYLHQGGRLDSVSGLYHFRNRDYSPSLGRWVSVDPIRFEGGDVNLYGFVGNNPANWVDPLGLASVTVDMEGWITSIIDKRGFNQIKGLVKPSTWTAKGLLDWVGKGIANGFASPADAVLYLNLLYMVDHLQRVKVSIVSDTGPDAQGKPCCKFPADVKAEVTITGDVKQSIQLPKNTNIFGTQDIGKVGYSVSFKAVVTSVERNWKNSGKDMAKVDLEMTIEVSAGPVEKTIKETRPLILICGVDHVTPGVAPPPKPK